MSEGEESNDQMDTNDTNDNSVRKLGKKKSVSKLHLFNHDFRLIILFTE
jgi:hypothetical protein